MSTFFKPYELFYYEKDNKMQTRAVDEFATKREVLERIEELKKIPGKTFVFEYQEGGAA
jgi:hypothetical protein